MLRSWLALGVLATATGCPPSHRMVAQGNGYFEHCYAADANPDVTDAQREACWNAWLAHYTRQQPSHRIDYALRRIEALQMGDMMLTEPASSLPASLEDPVTSANSMQVFAGEKKELPDGCATTCQQFRAECRTRCPDGGDACVESCKAYERTCLGGCY